MSELLFECYEIPSVCYGIDALFSWYHYNNSLDLVNNNKYHKNALIISSSNYSTHILPIVNNKFLSSHCKRINIGGYHCTDYIHKLLLCKYPPYRNLLSFDKAQVMININTRLINVKNSKLKRNNVMLLQIMQLN